MRVFVRAIVGLLAMAGLAALSGGVILLRAGVSANPEPSSLEVRLARRLRHVAIPAEARARSNPEPMTTENLQSGLEHFADHCAICHGNDGSGDTEMGRKLYPRAPDMRRPATQDLSDGELFYIVEQGVRLTGMPAWSTGTPEGERESWHLVRFVRHLPRLTDDQLEAMRSLNPRPASKWKEEEEIRRFLAGEGQAPPPPPEATHRHPGGPKR